MNNSSLLVYSRDRPLQLDLMLRSFYNCCKDYDLIDIRIIYKTTNQRFHDAYDNLKQEYNGVKFIEETNFKQNTIDVIKDYDYIFFFTDDSICINDFTVNEITKLLETKDNVLGFSLRLGKNTNYCFSCNAWQDIPTMKEYNDRISVYFWPRTQFDFSYCLEVSSSVYRVKDILKIIEGKNFNNPNQLEDVLYSGLWQFICFKYRMACYNQSVAFANPINQTTSTNKSNRTGKDDKYTPQALLELYEKGARIRADKFYGLVTHSAHQLVELF